MADRPAGKKSTTSAGTDDVASPTSPPPSPPPSPPQDERGDGRTDRDRPRTDSVHDDPQGDQRSVDDDLLDMREQRKSASRKAPGPADDRVTVDDVVIDSTPSTPVGPTEPA